MTSSRLPTLTALFLALLLGAAPWRVCAHGDHSGIWVPGLHAHGAPEGASPGHAHGSRAGCSKACGHQHARGAHRCGTHRSGTQAAGSAVRHAHPAQHRSTSSTSPGQAPIEHDGCHCDDQPLAKCLRSVPVEIAAPQLSGWRDVALDSPAAVRATGVAPLPREAWRVACESDPIVLLR